MQDADDEESLQHFGERRDVAQVGDRIERAVCDEPPMQHPRDTRGAGACEDGFRERPRRNELETVERHQQEEEDEHRQERDHDRQSQRTYLAD